MTSNETRRRILHTVVGTVAHIAAVAGFALAALFLIPGLFGFERYVITGGSMSGTFERGSLVFERAVPVSDLKVGDIITYMPPTESGINELVTHRIDSIEATEQGSVFRTRGDANASADTWTFMLEAPTQARFDVAVPHVGWAFIALADKELRTIIIGIPAGIIAIVSLLEVTRVLREPKAAQDQEDELVKRQSDAPVGTSVA